MKNIAIYGIGGLYNYGCEAIVRGSVNFIKRRYGEDTAVTYYSRNYAYDKKITDELGISIVNIRGKSNFFKRCISKAIDITRLPIVPFFHKEFKQILDHADGILSVGGDIYTIPAYLRSHKKYRYVNYLVEFGKKAVKAHKPLLIYGASVGPFGDYAKARDYYADHLKTVDGIICREKSSVDYLHSIGISDNVTMLPDPAFLVEDPEREKHPERQYIGINLSELSLVELYGSVDDEKIKKLAMLLASLHEKTGLPLMLIPHVISPYENVDNDAMFLQKVYQAMPDKLKENCVLQTPASFPDAKACLKQCKIALCARMHCAVNAITVQTPALFLSYSAKSVGMAEYVYGDTSLCISLKEVEEKLLSKATYMLENVDSLREKTENCMQRSHLAYDAYFDKVNLHE